MPELPEVETVRRGLVGPLEGQRLTRVDQFRDNLRYALPDRLAARLTGRRVDRLRRRGKYILADLDDGMVLVLHLGMSGRIVIREPDQARDPHDHIVFTTDAGVVVVFNDARRFGMVDLIDGSDQDSYPPLATLGPEPLDDTFTADTLAPALRDRMTPIKAALLDQRTVAGLGNIYVCEALFRARLSPRRQAGHVTGPRVVRLVAAIKAVLTEAIAAGGSSLRDYVQADGELGYFQHDWAVYGREGEPCRGCRCDVVATGGVKRIAQSNRSTFYCPVRQR